MAKLKYNQIQSLESLRDEKLSTHPDDLLLINDSQDSFAFKKLKIRNLTAGSSSGATKLIDLTDVTDSTPTEGNVLRADGTNWLSSRLDATDIDNLIYFDNVQLVGDVIQFTGAGTSPSYNIDLSVLFDGTTALVDRIENVYVDQNNICFEGVGGAFNSCVTLNNQFNDSQYEALLALIYKAMSITLTARPTAGGERGVDVPVFLDYQLNSNDDVIQSIVIDQGVGLVTGIEDDGILHTFDAGNRRQNLTFTMTVTYKKNGTGPNLVLTRTATYNAHIPQWLGWSSEEDFGSYGNVYNALENASNIDKRVIGNPNLTKNMSPLTPQYIWFVSTKPNARISGTSGEYTMGQWLDGTTEFWTKPVTMNLQGGLTETMYLYRTREKKQFDDIPYNIN